MCIFKSIYFSKPLLSRGELLGRHRCKCPHHPHERSVPCSVLGTMAPKIMELGMQISECLSGCVCHRIDYKIEFGNVHRFRTKGNNRRAPIVARFLYHRDLEYVLGNATKLKGRPYGIREQFPQEIEQKRKELYPVLKQAKQQNRQASLVRDRLYIDNQLYIPDTLMEDSRTEHTGSSSTNHDTSPKGSYSSDTPPSKRQRQGPSPGPPHANAPPNSGR
ncbi:unnamed protein product [Mytilus edulis]|uniref:Uncharacterized protein n=1 Tax=Mytilus edulis TaxID=6550 RepID=A0A8S3SFH7_MYTED|nr:unnamed protein product [Mytilus edulis]